MQVVVVAIHLVEDGRERSTILASIRGEREGNKQINSVRPALGGSGCSGGGGRRCRKGGGVDGDDDDDA